MPPFPEIYSYVEDRLKGLSPSLAYHNVGHTMDVLHQAVYIANEEGVDDEHLHLLKVSALFHDIGFLDTYVGHEERSCEIALMELPAFGFSIGDLDKICGMIRATRVPQTPQTKLEEILCDADLDYLGRPDFFSISEGLYVEFLDQRTVTGYRSWNELQVRFFESHSYFTVTAKKRRQAMKELHLKAVKEKLL